MEPKSAKSCSGIVYAGNFNAKYFFLPHCDNVTGALKEQRGGSSNCLCGSQLPPKIWEEENKIFPQDLLKCTYFHLHTAHLVCKWKYVHFNKSCGKNILIQNATKNSCQKKASKKRKKEILLIYHKILKYTMGLRISKEIL